MIEASPRSEPPPALRRQRLDGLPAPQELFVENLVAAGATWVLRAGGSELGYAITDGDDVLLELHIEDSALRYLRRALDEVIAMCGVRRIWAQSFDPLLMYLGLASEVPATTRGLLYRIIADPSFEPDEAVVARPGVSDDIPELARLSDDFFESEAEIGAYLAADGLMVYRSAMGNLLGAGVMKQVIAGRDDFDVGMVVSPDERRRGYGAYIVRHLKAHCLAHGRRPICGCSIENLASQQALERAGFASVHRLVEFTL